SVPATSSSCRVTGRARNGSVSAVSTSSPSTHASTPPSTTPAAPEPPATARSLGASRGARQERATASRVSRRAASDQSFRSERPRGGYPGEQRATHYPATTIRRSLRRKTHGESRTEAEENPGAPPRDRVGKEDGEVVGTGEEGGHTGGE